MHKNKVLFFFISDKILNVDLKIFFSILRPMFEVGANGMFLLKIYPRQLPRTSPMKSSEAPDCMRNQERSPKWCQLRSPGRYPVHKTITFGSTHGQEGVAATINIWSAQKMLSELPLKKVDQKNGKIVNKKTKWSDGHNDDFKNLDPLGKFGSFTDIGDLSGKCK